MNKNIAKLDWFWRAGGYDSALSAVMARWTALGYTHPSAAVLTSLNTLVTDLKAAGVWTGLDAFYVFMLNDSGIVSTTGTINYISPSLYAVTFPVAPTYTPSGFIGNGSTQYASVNFNPSTNGVNYTLNSASRFLYKYSDGVANDRIDGHASSGNDVMQTTNGGTGQRINSSNAAGSAVATNLVEYIAINRSTSTNISVYRGTTKQDTTQTSTALVNEVFTILRSSTLYGSSGISVYGLGRSFSETEHNNIRTAILAHKSRLGL